MGDYAWCGHNDSKRSWTYQRMWESTNVNGVVVTIFTDLQVSVYFLLWLLSHLEKSRDYHMTINIEDHRPNLLKVGEIILTKRKVKGGNTWGEILLMGG